MTDPDLPIQHDRLRPWIVAVASIAIWFLVATHSADAQDVRIPDFVVAQVLGRTPSAEATGPTKTVSDNLVAHRMQQDFRDQLVAGVSRPSVDLRVLFEWDSVKILAESVPEIEAAAEVLNRYFPDTRFRVAGFTDQSGEPDYNKVLSQRRASAVWHALVMEYGVAAERLDMVGFGEDGSVEDSNDAQHRRVELQIMRSDAQRL